MSNKTKFQRRDILKEVYEKKISPKKAEELYERLFNDYHNDKLKIPAEDFLHFSIFERTAVILGAIPFDVIARWRYEGWPDTCAICTEPLDYKEGNWRALKELRINDKTYKNVLTHWDCYANF